MVAMAGVRVLDSQRSGPPPPSPVRPDVVRAVRDQVGTGTYRPAADDVAERLVSLLCSSGA